MVVVIGILGIVAVLATCFVTLARLERRASQQRLNGTKALLLARSGIEDALARLSAWQDPEASGSLEGQRGSYALRVLDGGFSVNGGNPEFQSDPSFTSDVNTDLRHTLGILAEAIDREDGLDDGMPVDRTDGEGLVSRRPLGGWRSLRQIREELWAGDAAAQTRMEALEPYLCLRARTDRKVIRPNAAMDMVNAEYQAWADITTGRNNLRTNPAAPATRRTPDFERIGGKVAGRTPVSLAWARTRRPALIALLAGLKGLYLDETTAQSTEGTNAIGTLRAAEIGLTWDPSDDCHVVAEQILACTSELSTWDRFNAFCDTLAVGDAGLQTADLPPDSHAARPAESIRDARRITLKQAKRDLLKANFNPNSALNKFNPDRSQARLVDKSDLLAWSTEFDLVGGGTERRISSEGLWRDPEGTLLARRALSISVAPDRILRLTTQREFVAEDLGALDLAGDETDFRKYGDSPSDTGRPFIGPAKGPARNFAHRLSGNGYLNGSSRGVALQTAPEPHTVWSIPSGISRPSVEAGAAAAQAALEAAQANLAAAQTVQATAQSLRDAAWAAFNVDRTNTAKRAAYIAARDALLAAQAITAAAQAALSEAQDALAQALLRLDWISVGPAPASYDGQVRLATIETGTGEYTGALGQMMFLARWTEGPDADDVGRGVQPNEIPVDLRQSPAYQPAWQERLPGNLRPDGLHVEQGCQPGYSAAGNMPARRGVMSFWMKPNYDLSQYRDEFMYWSGICDRSRIFLNNTRTDGAAGGGTAAFLLMSRISSRTSNLDPIKPMRSAHGFGILWENNTLGANGESQHEQIRYTPIRSVPAHAWRLVTYLYDTEQLSGDLGTRVLVDRGVAAADRSHGYLYYPSLQASTFDQTVQPGGRAVFHLGLRGTIPWEFQMGLGTPDATFDEFALYDMGANTLGAVSRTETLARERFQAGRFYKESIYEGLSSPANTAGEYFSGPIRLLGAVRLTRLAWTQIVPGALKPLADPQGAAAARPGAQAAVQAARTEIAAAERELSDADYAYSPSPTPQNLARQLDADRRLNRAWAACHLAEAALTAANPGPEDADDGPEGRIVLDLADVAGTGYCMDASGRPLARLFTGSGGERVDRVVTGPFRLHAVFQPNLSNPGNTAILDPLALDDVTVFYEGLGGPTLLEWEGE